MSIHGRMRLAAAIVALTGLGLVCGCASHNDRVQGIISACSVGRYQAAAALARDYVAHAPARDRLIALLEEGAVLRAAGDFAASNAALDAADALFDKFDEEAKVRVGREAFASVTNLAQLPYRGFGYDRIMMNVYKALNYLALDDADHARNELRRVAYAQERTVARYQHELENLERARNKDDRAAMERAEFKQALAEQYQDLDELPDLSGEAVYRSPFAEYLQALFFLYAGDADDRSIGRTAMRNVAGMTTNPYLPEDVAAAERVSEGQSPEPMTYVVYETGFAPRRRQFTVRGGFPLGRTYVKFKAAFPVLERVAPAPTPLLIGASETTYPTAVLTDLDRCVAQEFKNALPGVITRTMITATAQAAAAYAAREAGSRTDYGGLISAGADLAQEAAAKADLRTWRTLPRQIQIARLPTPPDRKLRLSAAGVFATTVEVAPGTINMVYVKAIGLGDAPAVSQCRLK